MIETDTLSSIGGPAGPLETFRPEVKPGSVSENEAEMEWVTYLEFLTG